MANAELIKKLRENTGCGMSDCNKALKECNDDYEKAIEWLRKKGLSSAAKKSARVTAEGVVGIENKGNVATILEVNSETDFVAKNQEFTSMVDTILNTIISSNAKIVDEALNLDCGEGTINDLIVAKTAKIGEKLSLRRFTVVSKKDSESFGEYIHMGGKIAVLITVDGSSSEIARDCAMHAAAMRPKYVKTTEVPTDEVEKERTILKEQAVNEGKPAEIAEKMVEGRIRKFYEEVCLEEQAFVKDSDKKVKDFVKANGGEITSMIRYEVGEGMEKRVENFAEEVAKQMQ